MNEWEKLGLCIILIDAPKWINNLDGVTGLVLEVILFAGIGLFMWGGHIKTSDTHKS